MGVGDMLTAEMTDSSLHNETRLFPTESHTARSFSLPRYCIHNCSNGDKVIKKNIPLVSNGLGKSVAPLCPRIASSKGKRPGAVLLCWGAQVSKNEMYTVKTKRFRCYGEAISSGKAP